MIILIDSPLSKYLINPLNKRTYHLVCQSHLFLNYRKSKSDKTEDSHYVTEAKKIILEKSEDMNIDDAKST